MARGLCHCPDPMPDSDGTCSWPYCRGLVQDEDARDECDYDFDNDADGRL